MTIRLAAALGAALLLVAACGADRWGAWSPEKSDLLFTSNNTGNGEIYLLPAGAKEAINLTQHTAGDNWPAWSPDGTKIAFQSGRSANLDVWVMNADGTSPARLTGSQQPEYLPSWTPDGTRITFASWKMGPTDTVRAPHLWIMFADGGNPRRLVAETLGTSAGASWAPDGTRLVTTRKFGEEEFGLVLYDMNGENPERLTHGPGYNGAAEFSPDGLRIAFHCDRGDTSSIEVMNADGTGRRTVIGSGKNWYPQWSPDGSWLLYTTAVGGNEEDLDIYAVRIEGNDPPVRLVGGEGLQMEGRWRPTPP